MWREREPLVGVEREPGAEHQRRAVQREAQRAHQRGHAPGRRERRRRHRVRLALQARALPRALPLFRRSGSGSCTRERGAQVERESAELQRHSHHRAYAVE